MRYIMLLSMVVMSKALFGQNKDTSRKYWADGKLQAEQFNVRGPGLGYLNMWYNDGKPAAKYTYKDGLKFLYNVQWYENGNLKEEDIITGFDVVSDIDTNTGIYIEHSTYLSGRFISYSIKGNKITDGHYMFDRKVGKWYYYDENGKLIREELFEDGKLVSSNDYRIINK